jgi:hypothetical protein
VREAIPDQARHGVVRVRMSEDASELEKTVRDRDVYFHMMGDVDPFIGW